MPVWVCSDFHRKPRRFLFEVILARKVLIRPLLGEFAYRSRVGTAGSHFSDRSDREQECEEDDE